VCETVYSNGRGHLAWGVGVRVRGDRERGERVAVEGLGFGV
jgi:hypothetical protein